MSMDKKDLKGPDSFQSASDKLFLFANRHIGVIGAILGIVVVASLGWVGYGFYQTSVETKAAEALYGPEADLKKAETTVREERAKKMQELAGGSAKRVTKPELARPVDYAKDYASAVEKLKSVIKQYSGTKAAMMATMNLSTFLLSQKQYPEALEVLTLTSYRPSSSDIMAAFWHMHQGLTYMENQKFDEAAKAYQAVVDSKALAAFHPEAMLKLGVAYELKGQADKAKQTYEKIGRDFPGSEASSSAQQYLRLLELKSQQG